MKILAFAGSYRSGSLNRKLLHEAVRVVGDRAEVDVLDLRDLALPIYDGDIESSSGLPDGARRFKERIAAADALLIASPEYNHSIPGGLKNAIDWASRQGNPFRGKTALLIGASPGSFGAVRGHMALNVVITDLIAYVVPQTLLVPKADQAFDENGRLKDARQRESLAKAIDELLRITAALKGPGKA